MEQIKRFLRGKGFALALLACLVAAGAAGVWAVRAVRNELEKSYEELTRPEASSAPQAAVDVTEAANSVAGVPKAESGAASSGSSSGAVSGAGSVREPSALQGSSAPASSSAAPACAQPVTGRVLNACSGDELVYNKTLGDWRTHNGVDYACAQDAAVSAPVNGKVTAVETDGRWGGVVSIEDGEGRVWRVCGTADVQVKAGDTVSTGQTLGRAGNIPNECTEETHVHLEVLEGDKYLDPAKLIG